MAKDYPRSYRVADQLQRELSELIRHELKDPRVPDMVTVAGVEVSKDLANARVFVSAFTIEGEGAEKQNDLVDALNQGSGYLRKLLGGRMRLRVVPAMKFFYDEVQQTGSALSSLIDDAVAPIQRMLTVRTPWVRRLPVRLLPANRQPSIHQYGRRVSDARFKRSFAAG